MKKNAGKIVRLLVTAVMTAVLIGALGVMTSSAYKYTVTRYIGVEYSLPSEIGPDEYNRANNLYNFSDLSMVRINGEEITKNSSIKSNDTVEYIKTGELQMNHMWYYRDNSGSYSSTDTYFITVKEKEAFSGDIKVTYDEPFVVGKPFPELKVESEGNGARFLRAWFEITGAGTHDDEVIPDYYAGVEAEIQVELRPTEAYYFGWKDDDGPYWSPALSNVTINGKKVDASVFSYKNGNTLYFSFPVTIGAEVKEINITDLDVPTHGTTLDRTATASVGTVTAVRYEMYRKEINEVSKGDNIGVAVLVKLPEGYTFAEDSYAVWNGQVSEYRIRTASMGTDEYLYVFPVTVDVFSEQAYINSGSVFFTGDAMLEVGWRVPDRDYIDSDDNGIIYGDPIWTPADKTFKSGTTYTVKIPMELEPGYVWADDLKTNNSFSIESKDAVLVTEGRTTAGGKPKFETKKYIVAVFTPADIEGQTNEKYFDLDLSYSVNSMDLKVGDKATIIAKTNIDPMLASELSVQWYQTGSFSIGGGTPVPGANSTVLTVPTDKAGTKYYYCEISCTMMGEKSRLVNPPMPVKVTVSESKPVSGKFSLEYGDISRRNIIVYSSQEDFAFEVKAVNASPNLRFKWYECDKDGKLVSDTVYGDGQALLMYGIKEANMYRTFYYKCVANDGGNEQSLVFSCLLLPKKKALPFKDVQPGDPYYGSVWYANNHDPLLMNGVSADSFDPAGNLTRAAIVTVLYRLEGSPMTASSNEFYDVPAGQWYSDAVAWAVKKGITNGYGDGRFGPDDPITREQLAVFLYRYAKSRNIIVPAYGKLNQSDASQIDSWALDAMKWAYSKEIIEEVNGKLTPLDNAVRHMIATALTRFCVNYSM